MFKSNDLLGYGHATRVSAFTSYLLTLPTEQRPSVHIVSSAPEHVFSESIALGAHYRRAEIDPVVVQPLAYRVDRRESVNVLKNFLSRKEDLLSNEVEFLQGIGARCVLSDAAFLGCLAAKRAGIPSALITNFTFDSVYSYLATTIAEPEDELDPFRLFDAFIPDDPISEEELMPLVDQIHAGYRAADLLLTLPGNIPIPSFALAPGLPASSWVSPETGDLHPYVARILSKRDPDASSELWPPLPFPPESPLSQKLISRIVRRAPLLVRNPNVDIYTDMGRSAFLQRLGVPQQLHDSKILVVSFGGQVVRPPSRANSRPRTRRNSVTAPTAPTPTQSPAIGLGLASVLLGSPMEDEDDMLQRQLRALGIYEPTYDMSAFDGDLPQTPPSEPVPDLLTSPRLATSTHIWIPGAPPAFKPTPTLGVSPKSPTSTSTPSFPSFSMIPPTPRIEQVSMSSAPDDTEALLLPDETWIAIICGVTKEQWLSQGDEELPEGFYIAPRDVYMPDLTAIGDVVLGKLGYGTVSECINVQTPFVYVSRPIFVEEHGLRLLLEKQGVGVELSRDQYEGGDWADAVSEAYEKGKDAKDKGRKDGVKTALRREKEGMKMARDILAWVDACWANT
ncbi:hypothetical protein CYLTODRAFT_401903 [Cylindrobasidium torrendii FP15055 ss-10]|uniref:Uncharacterized protein n=1 Tax=Cylindrobasidium torrendii FP15055 ss-10 TaxID=1314674 RepID=A0A0D7B1C2_9AGAR|nr:hypothetical protein CYLTODRAFT_401903 [Cylindrobasidium torrendii FP15055 ss-10]